MFRYVKLVSQLQNCRTLSTFQLKKCVLVAKLSKLEIARLANKSKSEFSDSDWEYLQTNHEIEKRFENDVRKAFEELTVETRVVNKLTYTSEDVDWADLVVPIGGDGTFLIAANKITTNLKPIVGFNSNPDQSEGRLCLPKQYSSNVFDVLKKIKSGNFEWLNRTRIRVELENDKMQSFRTKFLHADQSRDRNVDEVAYYDRSKPILALNEVFIGEKLSAKVSCFEVALNETKTKLKCSGVCVSTGTGSTSWYYSINHVNAQHVRNIIDIINETDSEPSIDPNICDNVAQKFNQQLVFDPNDDRLSYAIRDLVVGEVWPQPKGITARGFANEIHIKSFCSDAFLVIDGGNYYDFNHGDRANLQVRHQDALKSIVF